MHFLKKIKRLVRPKRFFTNSMKQYKKYDIGDFTYGKPHISSPVDKIKIGKYCSIANGVTIYTSTDHNVKNISTYPFWLINKKQEYKESSKGGIAIENDVWIGDSAVILDGVKIGNGAVIGARSVVTKNVKPYEIVAGNPAKHIKYRFNEYQIDKLLQIAWWNWEDEKVKFFMPHLSNNDIENFIDVVNTKNNS